MLYSQNMETQEQSSGQPPIGDTDRDKQFWALDAHSRASRALITAKTPQALIEQVCRAVTEMPPYIVSWVGLRMTDSEKTVRVLGVSGAVTAKAYAQGISISWDASRQEGQGPTGQSIRSGKTTVLADTETDVHFMPWRERARTFGIRSSVSVPMIVNDTVIGAFMVYASIPEAFGDYEIRLFENLAREIAIGLTKFENLGLSALDSAS